MAQDAYDELPYIKQSYVHVDGLATLATLRGLEPPPIERCRVLEVGCASGSNLIAMAYSLPESHFVGIDLSATQIQAGQAMIEAVGLPNIELHQADLMAVDETWGSFDYLIAHGFYSWVPAPVRDKLLALCQRLLTPNGVAYVSYNVYPGWHRLMAVRRMVRYHTRDAKRPQARLEQAQHFLDFLQRARSTKEAQALLSAFQLGEEPGAYSLLLYDALGEENHPVYFHEFVAHAAEHGLDYLGDLQFASMHATHLPPEIREELGSMVEDELELEQYLDFVRDRTFRQSLLCQPEQAPSRTLSAAGLARLYFASPARPLSPAPSLAAGAVERFQGVDGATFATDHPVSKAAFLHLSARWPEAVPFIELFQQARAQLPDGTTPPAQDAQLLGQNLLTVCAASSKLMQAHRYQPPFVLAPGSRPEASAVARWQAAHGERLTNLWHVDLQVGPELRALLPHLDGQHTLGQIARQSGQPRSAVREQVQRLAHMALLVG